jgi:hypothetical protein
MSRKAGAYYGGTVAAPVFGQTMGEALRILNITPDDLPSMKIAGASAVEPPCAVDSGLNCWPVLPRFRQNWQIGR